MWSPLNGTLKNTLSGPPYRRFFSVLGKNWALCFFVTTLALLWQSLALYILLGQYLGNTWAIQWHSLSLLGHYLFGHCFGTTWALLWHYLGNIWALLGQNVLEITRKYKKEPGTIINYQKLPENTKKYQIVEERMWCAEISWQNVYGGPDKTSAGLVNEEVWTISSNVDGKI